MTRPTAAPTADTAPLAGPGQRTAARRSLGWMIEFAGLAVLAAHLRHLA